MIERRKFLTTGALALGGAALSPDAVFGAITGRRDADIIIRGGLVFDGLGTPQVEADVAIAGDRIVEIARRISGRAATEIDARGLAVAPGFVDIHSHTDRAVLVDPHAPGKLMQGVTTEVVGADGDSYGPWTDDEFERQRERWREHGHEIEFRDLGGFLRYVRSLDPATEIVSMVGNGAVRSFVIGEDDRPATPAEIERMVAEVERALAQGAVGLSSGLEYAPSGFASLDELVALSRPLAARGLPYMSHIRNEDDRLLAAVEEAIEVGHRAGVRVEISHLKAANERNWWKADPALDAIQRAHDAGIEVGFDVYPYVAYSTGLATLFPLWSRDGGWDAFVARLRDPAQRPAIEAYVTDQAVGIGSWDSIQISSTDSEEYAWARGGRLGTLAAGRGLPPYELAVELLLSGGAGMVGFAMSEENVATMIAHPLACVCSDGSALRTTGPLASGVPHPRNYGAFPRVLGRYVREQRVLSLESAIQKMTSVPAGRVGLTDRGRLAAGLRADVVVFDADTIIDRATFEAPHAYADGVSHVVVAGALKQAMR